MVAYRSFQLSVPAPLEARCCFSDHTVKVRPAHLPLLLYDDGERLHVNMQLLSSACAYERML